MKRILVDMSATLLHHGHIRLLKEAQKHGKVIVALTTDDQIEKVKGYKPELSYEFRKEILESIRYVEEVIPSPWLIDDDFLMAYKIDYLVHGADNKNPIKECKLIVYPRTDGISSSILRERINKVKCNQDQRS
jgi:glycerol-3-phosphate cytidylyltransferase